MTGRAAYARARRKPQTPQEAKLRPALEKIVKRASGVVTPAVIKVGETVSPTFQKVGNAVADKLKSGVKGYLKGTNTIADKLKPILDKLPKGPQRQHRMRQRRMQMQK